jgi:hypothetical protein
MQTACQAECPICRAPNAESRYRGKDDTAAVTCPTCGEFIISSELISDIDSIVPPELRPYLSAATRQATINGRNLRILTTNARELAETMQRTTIGERLDKLLAYIAKEAGRPGRWIRIHPDRDYPIVAAREQTELLEYLNYLLKEGSLQDHPAEPGTGRCSPTIKGWRQLEPVFRPGGEPGRCFVASWLDAQMDDPYLFGIKPAVEACHYKPVWMKEIPENKGITDRILSEIRRAEFVVADFTGNRHNVYYEAGFAHGLGREVISCCHRDHVEGLQFDTRHLGHVVWETPADLRAKLEDSIRANIIKKA